MVDFSSPPQLARSGPVPNCWPTARLPALAGLIVLVIVAVGLRLVPIIVEPSLNWGDEIFQTLEPAHRLVYGYGLVTWEFQLGMRSWLLPGFVAVLMEAARLIGGGPDFYVPAIAAVFALLASAPVICCFLWARRWYGFPAAFAGAALVAIAPELVYFGARALSETVAAHLLVIGFFLLQESERRSSRRRLFAAGALFGVACLLRIHMAPAVLVIALWASPHSWRSRLPVLIAGGLVAGAFGAALDWVSLDYPLASLWRNILFNIIDGVSADFGTEPWNYYLLGEFGLWGTGGVFMLVAAVIGARRLPALLAAALVIVAVHSGFAHKEYRFIYPAIVLITVLAGLGLAQLTQWAVEWLARQGSGTSADRDAVRGAAVHLFGEPDVQSVGQRDNGRAARAGSRWFARRRLCEAYACPLRSGALWSRRPGLGALRRLHVPASSGEDVLANRREGAHQQRAGFRHIDLHELAAYRAGFYANSVFR